MNTKNAAAGLYSLLLIIALTACTTERDHTAQTGFVPPLDGQAALESIEVMEGFRVELFAAEPLVQDPAAMEVDEQGRIYVVEMRSYPLDDSGLGRVKLLEDTNGDGFPDSFTIFADSLKFPKGVMRWKDGILVTDAPHLYYLEDSTGDGEADIREIMLTGFALSNPQHNFNTPIFGLDNWIYLANRGAIRTETYPELFGDPGSEVRFYGVENAPKLPQNAANRNVRFRPDSQEIETRSGWSQFGHTFDAWGRHFLLSNAHHHFHEAIAIEYTERNPNLPLRSAIHYTPEHGNAAEVYPVTINPEHQLLTDIGIFTSASGLTWYLGGAFPEEFNNVTFVAESVHNLVHADVVESDGTAFKARRLLEDREFMASKDSWFRPVHFYIGPDGALYVIDYYRRIIEHPQWMDDEIVETTDLYESTERGRIYRVVPDDMGSPDWTSSLDLENESVAELAGYLNSRNIWWRRTAQRLLVDRQDPAAIDPLKEIAVNSAKGTARLHAFWTLEGLDTLDEELIQKALRDEEPGVRENAIKLAEKRLNGNSGMMDALAGLSDDPSDRVRYQLVLTLGGIDSDRAQKLRDQILFGDIEDEWIQIGYLSGIDVDGIALMTESLEKLTESETSGKSLFFSRIAATITRSENLSGIRRLLTEGLTDIDENNAWWKTSILSGLAESLPAIGIDQIDFPNESRLALDRFFDADDERVRGPVMQLIDVLGVPDERKEQVLQQASAIAADRDLDDRFRADAIRLISRIDPESYEEALMRYSRPTEPSVVQQEAVAGLGTIPGTYIASYLLDNWDSMTPAVRDRAVDAMMQDDERMQMLLDAVEDNSVLISTIGWNRRVVLMRDTGGEIRERARELLREDPAERAEVLDRYRDALALIGDPARGKNVFRASCSECHQIREELGTAFGPDIATVRHWSPQALMSKILDPGRSIADGYEMWIVERATGSSVAGVIVEETSGSVTLRNAGGAETTILRSEIETISASNVSAMPSGLENEIDEQQMADLIAYIRSL